MNPTEQNNQDNGYNPNQPNGQPTALDNPTDSTQSSDQPSPNSQSPNINISGPNIQTSSPKMPSMNFGRPETNQANSSFQPSPGIPPKKSKKGLVIALIILLLIAIAGASYYFLVVSKNNTPSKQQANSTTTDQDKANTETGELVKTTIEGKDYDDGVVKASVEHPADFIVKESNQSGVKELQITSKKGNILILGTQFEGGGGCDPDSYKYTLIKKIKTKTPNVFFSEYKVDDSFEHKDAYNIFRAEVNSEYSNDIHKNLKEGESNKDICSNLNTVTAYKSIYIGVMDSSNQNITYDQIKDDTDFIAMLQSLEIVKE